MRTYEPRQGRNAATVVCSASAVVTLAFSFFAVSYQVIARKYRPQRFADVVGQDHVTQTLANAISQNRIAHAYLFVGPRGTGKTTMARIFAKCLNATNGPTIDFSDDDPRCNEITEGRSLDVLEIDGASNRGIEEVRELRETVQYAPATSRFKVYIIDEVHMLTKEAFNALLKTLEEPPAHVKFMFATTEAEKVLPTILSRCQRFDLRRIPTTLIVKHLSLIAGKENVQIDDAALYAVARGADGGMRDAESTLDQLISFCGSQIAESDVLSMFGLAARDQINGLAQAIVSGDVTRAIRLLDDLARGGKDLSRLLTDLLAHFRNLLVFIVSNGDLGLLEVSEAEAASLAQEAKGVDFQAASQILDVLTDAESRLSYTSSKKILFEVTLLKAIQARQALSIDSVLNRLQQLRSEAPSSSPTAPAPAPSLTPARPAAANVAPSAPVSASARTAGTAHSPSAPTPPAVASTATPNHSHGAAPISASHQAPPVSSPTPQVAGDLDSIWVSLLEQVGKASPFAKTYLIEAFPISLTANTFTIGLDPEFQDHLTLIDTAKNRTLLQTKLHEAGHGQVQIKFVLKEPPVGRASSAASEPDPSPAPPSQAAPQPTRPTHEASKAPSPTPAEKPVPAKPLALGKDDFKNDPLIRQALEIFKGTIVDVRN